jgi:hypothetical protein
MTIVPGACGCRGCLRLLSRAAGQQRFDEAAAVSSAHGDWGGGRRCIGGSASGRLSVWRREDDNAILACKSRRGDDKKGGNAKGGEAAHACLRWG